MLVDSKFKKDVFSFPNIDVPESEKNKPSYAIKVGQAIYSIFLKNKTGITTTSKDYFKELRQYGRAMQSADKYKTYLTGGTVDGSNSVVSPVDGSWNSNKEYERKGWMNVLWEPVVSPAVKIRDTIHGLFDEIDFDVVADAIDADSGAEQENKKWKLWITTRAFMTRAISALSQRAGLPMEPIEFVPESLTELEMYQEAGGFKNAYAIALEKLLKHTGDVSEWTELKRKALDDLIDLNIATLKVDYTHDEHKVKWRYVDPQDLVIQYSKHTDYRDAEYAGEFHDMKISELRDYMRKEGYSEDDIESVARYYNGKYDNPNHTDWESWRKDGGSYEDMQTSVFSFEYIDAEKDKKIKYTNKYGKVRYLPFEDRKLGNREEVVVHSRKVLRQGTWVVGTEYVFDHGPVHYQPITSGRVELTYKVVKLEGLSLTERLVPIYDNIHIGWLKYQNSLSAIIEQGYAVDFRMLQNISDGDKKYSAVEAIKMWKESGILPFMSTPVAQWYRGGGVVPAYSLPGGMGESLNQAIQRLQLQMQLIEHITGLSPVSLGVSPDPNAPVGTTERSLQATHNALKPMIRGIFYLKNQASNMSAIRIQQLVKHNLDSKKQYINVIGETDVESLVIAKSSNVEYGIRLEARPTTQEKLHILRSAEMALSPGRNGLPGINYGDYMYIVERLYAGANLKELRLYLVNARKKAEREAFAQQQMLVDQKAKNDQAIEQMRMQREAASVRMKAESDIATDNNRHRNTMQEKLLEMNSTYINELTRLAEADLQKSSRYA